MCGLVGVAGDLEYRDEALMKRLFILDYFRGPDSTGFAAITKTGTPKIVKVASHPIDLFDSQKFDKALSGYASKAFIGHNRAATRGKINANNAHPFEHGSIIGAHNGTLDRASWTRLEEAVDMTFEVDSEALIYAIDKLGIEKAIGLLEEGRTSTDGAWALTWYDTSDKTLNFLRNQHRPLWYALSKDFKKILWSSEWSMMDAAVKMASPALGVDLFQSEEGYRFWECKHDWWYKIDLEELAKGSKDRPSIRYKEVKGRAPAPAITGADPFRDGWRPAGTTTTTMGHSSTTTSGTLPVIPDVLDLIGTAKSPLGSFMDKAAFDSIAKYGCAWCGGDVEFTDVGVVILDNEEAVICGGCSGNDHSRIYADGGELLEFQEKLAV